MVIDTSALVAIELKEPGADILLKKIAASPVAVVATPTLLETTIVLTRRMGHAARSSLAMSMRYLRIQVIPFTEDHFDIAADAFLRFGKGRHEAALNFGDCMSYAVAALSGLPLLYKGDDFSRTDIEAA
jgi:ribonuclease VapC